MEKELTPMPLPESCLAVMRELTGAGFRVYTVGGSVRDHLRGIAPHDYDMTTDATPDEMRRVFAGMRLIETGARHGTVTVLCEGEPYEVTTYRVDGAYADHRHPDSVSFTKDLTGDLARRDFTMNAIAFHPEEGYIDPFGGMGDIDAQIIRTVGNPEKRFEEDALRILRALRFAAVLGFTIEDSTRAAIFASRGLLRNISAERIRDELMKLLGGKNAAQILREYREVIAVCIPELIPLFGCPQNTSYHIYDVWEHTLRVVDNLPQEPLLRLMGLLHDIGKPACRTTDAAGTDHFKGHAPVGAEIADGILARLRFDNKSRDCVRAVILHHDDRTTARRPEILRLLAAIGYPNFLLLLALEEADTRAHNPASPATRSGLNRIAHTRALGMELETAGACYRLRDLAMDGAYILAHTPLRGAAVGAALNRLLDAVIDGSCENTPDALARALETIVPLLKTETPPPQSAN